METLRSYLFFLYLFLVRQSNGFPAHLLYEHTDTGTDLPKLDDISSPEVKLRVPITFYGQKYTSIFVNSNGLLSFQTEIPSFFNIEFPLDYPVIAPLYSNIDTSGSGTVNYYETDNQKLLTRATTNVHDSFSDCLNFEAKSLFVVTWYDVGYHKGGTDRKNTFQVAISSDGDDSFVEFLYPEGGIQWIQGTGDESGLPDARAQAGFVGPDGRFFLLKGSGTDSVKNLEKWSNMKLPGQWIFRVGRVDQDKNVEDPDVFKEGSESTEPKTCSKGASLCHTFAKCEDFEEGFCCSCREQYYGNGKFCVKKDAPLRVNGKVSGKINEEIFSGLDLQSYIVMSDGRTYTAISKIPESIGYDIQSLQILGNVIGWLFAKPVSTNNINGYQLTGGVFNHTATIHFLGIDKTITLRHKYHGLDLFDQLRLEVDIQGELPHIPAESKVTMPDFEEQVTLTAPGVLQSSSKKTLISTFDGSETTISFSVDQSFVFDYCKFKPAPVGTTWRLKSSKNFISYESREQIVRFGVTNKVGPLGSVDPCIEGRATCGPNSSCVVEDDNFRCVCNPGYQYIYKDSAAICQDINECQSGLHDCDYNAQCVNEIGTFACRCNPGFEGDGRFCQNSQTCRNVQCTENAECIEDGLARCVCLPGFTGNGNVCVPVTSKSCHVENNCSPYGACTINPTSNEYYCVCISGYYGDGYNCQPEERSTVAPLPETTTAEYLPQQCLFGHCWCPSGFRIWEGTQYCIPEDTTTEYPTTSQAEPSTEQDIIVSYPQVQCFDQICFCPRGYLLNAKSNICTPRPGVKKETMGFSGFNISCNVINNCHRNAQCIYDLGISKYLCVCNIGFEGDGYECKESLTVCTQSDSCDVHASCVYHENLGTSLCICDTGYQGNGKTCHLATCSNNNDCPPNEECVYTTLTQGYECACKEGFARDSQQQCVVHSGTCGGGRCAENAECLYDDEYQTHYCTCKSDYVGDGITECKPRPVGCNVVNNCGLHSTCAYDKHSSIYQCKCDEGFFGDGTACFPERNCHVDPYICDSRAVCVSNAERKFVCECQPGYVGNGTFCKESPRYDGNFLILNQGNAVFRIPFDSPIRESIKPIHLSEQMAIGLDIDCFGGRIYWSDISNRKIKTSSYNGSNVTDFISQNIGSPEGLSIDWVSRNIYWTDSAKDTIEVANLETKLRATLFNTGLVNPRGIAVHPQRGKIFWADWNRVDPKIEWANADGTGRAVFLKGDTVKLPNSLVIDFDTEQLCYADAGTKKIECVDIDSKYQQTIAVNCTYPFGIAVTDRHIYWSDWISKKVELVDKRTLHRLPPIDVPAAGSGKMYGLVAVPERCAGLVNVCQYGRDQCPGNHLCLPNASGSRTCLCGYKADSPDERVLC